MARRRLSQEGLLRLDTLRTQVTGLRVHSAEAQDARSGVLDQIWNVSADRRLRAMDANWKPPAAVLGVTILAGLLVTVFPFLVGSRPRGMTLVPLMAMAALLGVGIYLTFDISHVFAGALSVKPDAFTSALAELERTAGGR